LLTPILVTSGAGSIIHVASQYLATYI
jgi:hypothetical protein